MLKWLEGVQHLYTMTDYNQPGADPNFEVQRRVYQQHTKTGTDRYIFVLTNDGDVDITRGNMADLNLDVKGDPKVQAVRLDAYSLYPGTWLPIGSFLTEAHEVARKLMAHALQHKRPTDAVSIVRILPAWSLTLMTPECALAAVYEIRHTWMGQFELHEYIDLNHQHLKLPER